jgi:auxin efflux carrier family protein
MLFGLVLTKLFKMPPWTTPAIAFNNTTSMPLLLVQSLAATKLLDVLDSSGTAVARAKSYFLINSMVSNTLTFAFGPKLITQGHGDAANKACADDGPEDHRNLTLEQQEAQAEAVNEQTSLLPIRVARVTTHAEWAVYKHGRRAFKRLPNWIQSTIRFLLSFVSPPVRVFPSNCDNGSLSNVPFHTQ